MEVKELKVKSLGHNNFKAYGTLITRPEKKPFINNDEIQAWNVEDVLPSGDIIQINWLEQIKKVPYILTKMDCHTNCSEVYIPMQGQSILVVALNKRKKDGKNFPDINTLSAFYIDGEVGVCMKPSIWHWLPFPLSERTNFVIVSMKDKINRDTILVDLESEFDLNINIVL